MSSAKVMIAQSSNTAHNLDRYRQLLRRTGCVCLTLDQTGTIISADEEFAELVGMPVENLSKRPYLQSVAPAWHRFVRTHHERLTQQTSSEAPIAYPLYNAKGRERWVQQLDLIPQVDCYELILQPITASGVFSPIFQQDFNATDLMPRFRGLFESNGDAVFFIDLEGVIQDVNPKAEGLFGYTKQEFIGSPAMTHIVDARVSGISELVERLRQGEKFPIYKYECRCKDGSTFPAEINVAMIFDAVGNPSHLQSIVRDISERKRIQETLALQVEHLTILRQIDFEIADRLDVDHVIAITLDAAARLSGADAGFIALLGNSGLYRVTQVIGDYATDITDNVLHNVGTAIAQTLETQKPHYAEIIDTGEERIIPRAQSRTQILIPFVSRDLTIGLLNLEADRSDRFNMMTYELLIMLAARVATALDNAYLHHQTQAQLTQVSELYDHLHQLEKFKSEMIRLASHDLRNPIGVLNGYVQLLQMQAKQSGTVERKVVEEYTTPMMSSLREVESIVTNFLSLERIEERAQIVVRERFALNPLVQRLYETNLPRAWLKSQTLDLLATEQRLVVYGDIDQLREALNNLMSNAVKYTPTGGEIQIRLGFTDDQAIFEVEDNGIGIEPEHYGKLFQPFYRAHQVKNKVEGSGLGLYLVKTIIERHKGQIIFESRPGEGTTFTCALPATLEIE